MIVLINFQNTEIDCNVVKINKKEFVILSYSDKYFKFWELIYYFKISYLQKNSLINRFSFEDDILYVGGYISKGFYLTKTSTH